MAKRFLDENGLLYFWKKIITQLNSKAPLSHSHKASEVSDLSSVIPDALADLTDDSTHRTVTDAEKSTWNAKSSFSGSYSDLSNIPIIANKGHSNGATWYFPLGEMVIDNSGNFGNFTFDGRIGGWTNANSAVYSIMLMNRGNYDGSIITSTVSASGAVDAALGICDIVVAKNSDLSHTVYLACTGYFLFNFAWTAYQHAIAYDGTYSTTAPSDIIWRLSTAPKTILSVSGVFSASGGIDATTLGGKTIVFSEGVEPTVNDTNVMTVVY